MESNIRLETSPSDQLPFVVIACKVFQHLFEELLPRGMIEQVTILEYGLHLVPGNLKSALQDALSSIKTPSTVVLGYGLCGNGLHGVRAGNHTLLIPRVDDCIAIFMGSYQRYLQEFKVVPGTYYLTKGWLESGGDPLTQYQEITEKYGPDKANWIMDQQYQHYERLVLVAHTQAELEAYRSHAIKVAKYCQRWGMRYEEMLGSDSTIRRLIEAAASPENADEDLVIIPPGGEIRQDMFFRAD